MAEENSGKGAGPFVQIASEPDRNEDYKSPHYELHNREVWFSKEMIAEQNRNQSPLWQYIRSSRLLVG